MFIQGDCASLKVRKHFHYAYFIAPYRFSRLYAGNTANMDSSETVRQKNYI